jgi:hypothetical protein
LEVVEPSALAVRDAFEPERSVMPAQAGIQYAAAIEMNL